MPGPGRAQHSNSTTYAVTFSYITMHEHARITTRVVLVNRVVGDIISQLPEITLNVTAY